MLNYLFIQILQTMIGTKYRKNPIELALQVNMNFQYRSIQYRSIFYRLRLLLLCTRIDAKADNEKPNIDRIIPDEKLFTQIHIKPILLKPVFDPYPITNPVKPNEKVVYPKTTTQPCKKTISWSVPMKK
mgnify:CR=1 FL=1